LIRPVIRISRSPHEPPHPMTAESERRGRARELTDRVSERAVLDQLIEQVRVGESQSLVLRGDPGMGKTVLLDYLAGQAASAGCQVARAFGVQSEMEPAFAW
jgi:ABC-type transporter Mla maintaining outer membrane lipid asymmetry ATPase subunit MlaF